MKKRPHLSKNKVPFHQDNALSSTYTILEAPCDLSQFITLKMAWPEKFTSNEMIIYETNATVFSLVKVKETTGDMFGAERAFMLRNENELTLNNEFLHYFVSIP